MSAPFMMLAVEMAVGVTFVIMFAAFLLYIFSAGAARQLKGFWGLRQPNSTKPL